MWLRLYDGMFSTWICNFLLRRPVCPFHSNFVHKVFKFFRKLSSNRSMSPLTNYSESSVRSIVTTADLQWECWTDHQTTTATVTVRRVYWAWSWCDLYSKLNLKPRFKFNLNYWRLVFRYLRSQLSKSTLKATTATVSSIWVRHDQSRSVACVRGVTCWSLFWISKFSFC